MSLLALKMERMVLMDLEMQTVKMAGMDKKAYWVRMEAREEMAVIATLEKVVMVATVEMLINGSTL